MRIAAMSWLVIVLFVGLAASAGAADSVATPFDGPWHVTLTCPPHDEDDEAKGYVHHFPATVSAGVLRGTHATEDLPGWHYLSGTIAPDGSARLTLDGIVANADYAVNHGYRGKPYSYRVRAKFEATHGSGQRIGRRKCDFEFRRP